MGSPVNQNENLESPTTLLRRLHHWRMAFFGLVILIAGITTGAAGTFLTLHFTNPGPPGPQPTFNEEMMIHVGRRLRLSAEQMGQVRPILRKHMQTLDEIREEGRSQILAQLRLMNDEMSAVLKTDQEQMWQDLLSDLPGPFRPGPRGYGPGPDVGPGPGLGPGGGFGQRRGGFGPRRGGFGQRRNAPNDTRMPYDGETQPEQ